MSGYNFLYSREVECCYKDYAIRPNFGQFDPVWEGDVERIQNHKVDQQLLDFIMWCVAENPAITGKEITDHDLCHIHNTLGILEGVEVYSDFFTKNYSNLTNFFSIDLIKTKKRIFALLYTIGSLLSQIKELPRKKGSEDTDYATIRTYFVKPRAEATLETPHNFQWSSTSVQALGTETRKIQQMLDAYQCYIDKETTGKLCDAGDVLPGPYVTPTRDGDLSRSDRQEETHHEVPRPVRGPGDFRPFPSFPPPTVECRSTGDNPHTSQQDSHGSDRSSYSYPTTDSEANPLLNVRSANNRLALKTTKLLHRTVAVSQVKWDNVRSTFPQVREQLDGQLCISGMSYIVQMPFRRDVRGFKLATSHAMREQFRLRMALFLKKNHITSGQYRVNCLAAPLLNTTLRTPYSTPRSSRY
jgi:hypothetical protein